MAGQRGAAAANGKPGQRAEASGAGHACGTLKRGALPLRTLRRCDDPKIPGEISRRISHAAAHPSHHRAKRAYLR